MQRGAKLPPWQDEAEPGGGNTAAHLAVRDADSLLPNSLETGGVISTFRNCMMGQSLGSCKEFFQLLVNHWLPDHPAVYHFPDLSLVVFQHS
jgi:hypothetical protein